MTNVDKMHYYYILTFSNSFKCSWSEILESSRAAFPPSLSVASSWDCICFSSSASSVAWWEIQDWTRRVNSWEKFMIHWNSVLIISCHSWGIFPKYHIWLCMYLWDRVISLYHSRIDDIIFLIFHSTVTSIHNSEISFFIIISNFLFSEIITSLRLKNFSNFSYTNIFL